MPASRRFVKIAVAIEPFNRGRTEPVTGSLFYKWSAEMKTRDEMRRKEFAAEKSTAVPFGMSASILLASCPETLQAWREAVVNHYFGDDGKRYDLTVQLRRRHILERAYAAVQATTTACAA
jgi:hypothetical protein